MKTQSQLYLYYLLYIAIFILIVYKIVYQRSFRYSLGQYLKSNVSPSLFKIYGNPGEAAFGKAAQAILGKVAQPIAVGAAVIVGADVVGHQTGLSQAARYTLYKNAGIDHNTAQREALSSKSLLEKSPYFTGKYDQNASSD